MRPTMRLLTLAHLLSLLTFAALPLATSLPKYPRRFYYGGISKQLEKRAYFGDVSQFDFAPFNVTELRIFCDRLNRTVDYSCNLTFNWFDPNSVRQNRVTSGSCLTSWSWDGVTKYNATIDGSGDIADYRWCWIDEGTYFMVSVPSFWHPGNFSIELAHRYRDAENFTIPWEYPTTFAAAQIRLCANESLENNIYHYTPGPFNGTVFGLID